MIKQYPYDLFVNQPTGSTHDTHGNPIKPVDNWVKVSKCRDEVNSKGSQISLTDGTYYAFDALIQLPKSCPIINEGTSVRIMQGDFMRQSGSVKRFQADQFHSRLWL